MDSRAARADLYRDKAAEICILSDSMKLPANRDMLLDVAQDYLNLATTLDCLVIVGEH